MYSQFLGETHLHIWIHMVVCKTFVILKPKIIRFFVLFLYKGLRRLLNFTFTCLKYLSLKDIIL